MITAMAEVKLFIPAVLRPQALQSVSAAVLCFASGCLSGYSWPHPCKVCPEGSFSPLVKQVQMKDSGLHAGNITFKLPKQLLKVVPRLVLVVWAG